nr:MFS transporter [Planobispora longispora]
MSASHTGTPGPAADPKSAPSAAPRGLGRGFWTLFSSSTVSNLADGMGRVALPLLAVSLTREPVLVAALTSLTFLPWLLFAVVSGALVDRVDRRRAMIAAQVVRTVIVGLLGAAVLTGQAALWMLYVAAFALGAVETLYDNAAHSMTPAVVRRDQLEKANGRVEAASVVADSFLGAPLASALFVAAAALPFLANSTLFLLAGVLLLFLPGRYRAEPAAGPGGPRTCARRSPRGCAGSGTTGCCAGSPRSPPPRGGVPGSHGGDRAAGDGPAAAARRRLRLVRADRGIGGVVGGLIAPVLTRRWPRAVVMAVALTTPGVCFVLIAALPFPATLAVATMLGAGSIMVWNILIMSLRQALVPPALFGRVLGAIRTVLWGFMPLGALCGGLLAEAFGLRALAVIGGCLMLLLMVPLGLILHRHRAVLRTLNSSDTVDT